MQAARSSWRMLRYTSCLNTCSYQTGPHMISASNVLPYNLYGSNLSQTFRYGSRFPSIQIKSVCSTSNLRCATDFSETEIDGDENGSLDSLDFVGRLSPAEREAIAITSVYNDVMANPHALTEAEWNEVGNRFSENHHLSIMWSRALLHFIVNRTKRVSGLYVVGMSLLEYIASRPDADRHRMLRLLATISLCVHQSDRDQHDRAFSAYDELCTISDVFDSVSTLILIQAFAKTDRWQTCLDFIEMAKIASVPTVVYYSPIIAAAVTNGDEKLCDNLLETVARAGFVPTEDVYTALIELGRTEKLVEVLKKYEWIPQRTIADHIVQYLQSHESSKTSKKFAFEETRINRRGECKACGRLLDRLQELSVSEFAELRVAFLQKSLMRDGNVFLGSSPEEVSAFGKFLDHHKSSPFDVIIDGLNVAYTTYQRATVQRRSLLLERVVRHFVERNKKVLVLGRKHMTSWKAVRSSRNHGNDRVDWFFTDNISSDDPFMMYAALYCGQSTLIVTSDELRDHRFLLGSELAGRLKTWQRGHQVMFNGIWIETDSLRFKWPDVHSTAIQQTSDGASWHVPFETEDEQRASYQLTQTWFCVHPVEDRGKLHRDVSRQNFSNSGRTNRSVNLRDILNSD